MSYKHRQYLKLDGSPQQIIWQLIRDWMPATIQKLLKTVDAKVADPIAFYLPHRLKLLKLSA